ncbi:MAG TPA: cytochrome c3 family protein [Armatimonadota bacterium]|nr:cytochrome c3 family protein [Armatimonadota bacterium]
MAAESKVTILTIVVLLGSLIALYAAAGGMAITNATPQPIDFFHRVHAGEKHIACAFCHRTYRTEAYAGMPSTELCMRCHRVVIPHHPEIQLLHQYWDSHKAIPWERVNRLPGFVFFDHQAHVKHGVACAVCHGPVAQMDRLIQTAPLTMGWCVQCHRSKRASIECATCHR